MNIEIDPQTQAVVDTVERVLANREATLAAAMAPAHKTDSDSGVAAGIES